MREAAAWVLVYGVIPLLAGIVVGYIVGKPPKH
jgi:hypothetical protein